MTLTNPGGEGGGPAWLAPALILAIFVSPVLLGLALRLWDRRAGAAAAPPAPVKTRRRGLSARFILGCAAVQSIAIVFAFAGVSAVAIPLTMICAAAALLRRGYRPRP